MGQSHMQSFTWFTSIYLSTTYYLLRILYIQRNVTFPIDAFYIMVQHKKHQNSLWNKQRFQRSFQHNFLSTLGEVTNYKESLG